jgi:hypothetical protein
MGSVGVPKLFFSIRFQLRVFFLNKLFYTKYLFLCFEVFTLTEKLVFKKIGKEKIR